MQARRTEMTKTVRARYTLEFKQEAVRLVTGGQSIAAAARSLGIVEQTLFNWVKAERAGKLKGADSKVVSAEQMEISRLRAELARVRMERDILGKATASIGAAQLSARQTAAPFMEAADQAVQVAKRGGRNQVQPEPDRRIARSHSQEAPQCWQVSALQSSVGE
jgi:transposase